MRDTFLPFASPDVGEEELAEIRDALHSGWVTTGPKVREFEAAFAETVGARCAVAVNSCTAAMHLALEALGLGSGDEVITTPYTFTASAEVVRYFDATPVFVDVEPRSLNIDPEKIESAVSERTKAIIPVHIGGLPADLSRINEIGRKHGLNVVEDAAHAFPAAYRGRTVGSISDFTCFSFYATKTITTGEGGMICTDNEEWAERCRIMSLHGISRDAWNRSGARGSWYYEVIEPGYKYNMTDIAAAMGLAQLRRADRMRNRRREIASRYDEAFSAVKEIEIPCRNDHSDHAWHLYMLRLQRDMLDIDRNAFIREMKRRKIGTSVHFIPLHIQPYYRDTFRYGKDAFPVAYREYEREVSLPIYSGMADQDADDVIEAVLSVIAESRTLVSAA